MTAILDFEDHATSTRRGLKRGRGIAITIMCMAVALIGSIMAYIVAAAPYIMGCCLSFLSRLRPSAVTRRKRTDSWTSGDEHSAWAFLGRERQEEEAIQLERERQDLDAQEFLAMEGHVAF